MTPAAVVLGVGVFPSDPGGLELAHRLPVELRMRCMGHLGARRIRVLSRVQYVTVQLNGLGFLFMPNACNGNRSPSTPKLKPRNVEPTIAAEAKTARSRGRFSESESSSFVEGFP